jgi:hypothetical protein
VLRVEARRSLRLGRLVWKGLDRLTAELELSLAADDVWTLKHVRPEETVLAAWSR